VKQAKNKRLHADLGVVVHTYNSSYSGGGGNGRAAVLGQLRQKLTRPYLINEPGEVA
jgi:hypothetical protein